MDIRKVDVITPHGCGRQVGYQVLFPDGSCLNVVDLHPQSVAITRRDWLTLLHRAYIEALREVEKRESGR